MNDAELVESWLERLFDDPDERARFGEAVQRANARGGKFLREIGIDPKQDTLKVGGVIVTAIAAADLSDSPKRLEEANRRLEEMTQEFLAKTHELVTETRVLKVLTGFWRS